MSSSNIPSAQQTSPSISPEPLKPTYDNDDNIQYLGTYIHEPGTFHPIPIKTDTFDINKIELNPTTDSSLINSLFSLKNIP